MLNLHRRTSAVDRGLTTLKDRLDTSGATIEIEAPSGKSIRLGAGAPRAKVVVRTPQAWNHLLSLDEERIADAFVSGEIDVDGPLIDVLDCRRSFKVRRGWSWLTRFAYPRIVGQVKANRTAIHRHYELDPAFYLGFLDSKWPAYSQGTFVDEKDDLSTAIERKFAYATSECRITAGSRVLEVGPGWGAYLRYLLPTGAKITTLSNSAVLNANLRRIAPPDVEVQEGDFLSYRPKEKFEAVTMMGVLEHLPQYETVCAQFRNVLKPGGYAYVDASAAETKYDMSPFIYKHVFPYNHSFLHLGRFCEAAKRAGLRVVSVGDETLNYMHTCLRWAANLDARREEVVEKYGAYNYRRFRLYLWGSAYGFERNDIQCYRVLLQAPA